MMYDVILFLLYLMTIFGLTILAAGAFVVIILVSISIARYKDTDPKKETDRGTA